MFLNDHTFNSLDALALAGLGGLAAGAQALVKRKVREGEPRLSEREYPPTGSALPTIERAYERSAELSRQRRGLA